MLIHLGNERSAYLDRRLAFSLAFIAGSLNSAGFYSLGFFAGNMTGNVSTGADRIALGDILNGAVYLLLPVVFILGAIAATLLVDMGLRRKVARIYAYGILCEAAMLALLGVLDLLYHSRGTLLIFGLSTLMGFQNAVVTRISNWRVRTTHISGIATDIGIGIGTLASSVWGKQPHADSAGHLEKLRLHAVTILAFCVGGVIGVVIYKMLGGVLLLIAAALLVVLALPSTLARVTPREAPATGAPE